MSLVLFGVVDGNGFGGLADMLLGWWKVTDMEELKALVNTLHSRGVRERALQKQLQKSMELIAQTCNKNREGEHHVETDQNKMVFIHHR